MMLTLQWLPRCSGDEQDSDLMASVPSKLALLLENKRRWDRCCFLVKSRAGLSCCMVEYSHSDWLCLCENLAAHNGSLNICL